MKKLEIGPVSASLLEPVKYLIRCDENDVINDIEVRHGYAYRAIETIVEGKKYPDALYAVERICGICSITHTTNFCQGIEKILGVQIPERAAFLRVISCELERIQSHLFVLAEIAHRIKQQEFQRKLLTDREAVLKLLEDFTGNRILHSINVVGGVKKDIAPEFAKKVVETLDRLEKQIQGHMNLVRSQRIHSEFREKGILDRSSAVSLGAVGPVGRGSGVHFDIRRDLPYAAYAQIPFESMVRTEGDVEARAMVRLGEILESIKIVKNAIDHLPPGPILDVPMGVTEGQTAARTEAPRGELLHFIKLSDRGVIEKFHLRTPTKGNMNILRRIAIGESVKDFQLIVTSLDPCIACFDSAMIRA